MTGLNVSHFVTNITCGLACPSFNLREHHIPGPTLLQGPTFKLSTDTISANMCAAGMLSTADAEGSDPTDDSDDGNTSAAAPRRRLTRAGYDAGYGNSSDGWSGDGASDDEGQINDSADRARPVLAGGVCGLGVRGARALP